MQYYEINETQARQAKGMWSFTDYVMGSETSAYQKRVDEAYALCEDAPEERKEKALYYADMYAKKLAENINKGFRIELQCPSVMICGASNFPARKKEKQNAARDKNFKDYEYIKGYLDKIKDLKYAESIIKSGDENAVELLQAKVNELETLQAEMKAANAYYRKNKTMRGYGELADETAAKLDEEIKNGYSWEQCPYASYNLTNNNAKLKAAKQRLESLLKVKSQDNTEIQHEKFKVVRNTELMRLQLFFDGKPDEATRTLLKSHGFKWAPSQLAWQRQLTNNAIDAYREIAKKLEVTA